MWLKASDQKRPRIRDLGNFILPVNNDIGKITRESVRMPPIWPSQLRYTACCELSNIVSKYSMMWSAVNAVDSIGVSYTYARGKQLVVRNSLLYGREVTFVRIFLAYFETHIGYNARIALAVTFKICSKISASTTPKIKRTRSNLPAQAFKTSFWFAFDIDLH